MKFVERERDYLVYQAFYRVYRPQTFRDMSGQAHVKRTLQNALLANKTTHAYLFSGPRGTGKTSTAKIFAKALNCEHAPVAEPCNECATCKSITDGTFNDVIEFDAASNSRVEEIREVIENVRFAPASARFKVYIIDEVHMLSTSAFNALLKTLEEPPSHVVFILATTEPHKLPATIISRCQRFDFKRLSTADIIARLEMVLEDINLTYDEQALKVIAQSAAGGMRDALSLLDQVVSFSGDKVELADTLLIAGAISQDVFYEVAQNLQQQDVGKVLTSLEQLIADGKDPLRLTEDFITFFRDLLMIQADTQLADILEIITYNEKVEALAQSFSAEQLYTYIDILSKTQQEMRFSHHTKVYLETALLQMAQLMQVHTPQAQSVDPALQQKVQTLEQTVQRLSEQIANGVPQQQTAQKKSRTRQPIDADYQAPIGRIRNVLQDATKQDIQTLQANWAQILGQMQKSQSARFAEAEPVAASASAFVLKFKYAIHCKMVAEDAQLKALMAQLVMNYTGKQLEMLCIPAGDWAQLRADFVKNYRQQKDSANTATEPHKSTQAIDEPPEELLSAEEQEPQDLLVSEAEKIFGSDFVEVYDD